MTERRVEVFFYGLFMDERLLRAKQISPMNPRRASVNGFGLRIGKRATLVPANQERSYGVVMQVTQDELDVLYSGPGLESYRPQEINCTTLDGEQVCAICYNLLDAPAPDEANEQYASELRSILTTLGFPAAYITGVR